MEGGGGKFPRLSLSGGEVPPPEDLVQSRHSEISATFEIRKKSYWPYLRVLHPVDAIYIHSPSISINIGVQLGGGGGGYGYGVHWSIFTSFVQGVSRILCRTQVCKHTL